MNDFEQVISNLAKESGLPLAIDNKNSVTLEYDDIFITLQWLLSQQAHPWCIASLQTVVQSVFLHPSNLP